MQKKNSCKPKILYMGHTHKTNNKSKFLLCDWIGVVSKKLLCHIAITINRWHPIRPEGKSSTLYWVLFLCSFCIWYTKKKKYQNKKRPFFCLLFYPIIWCYCRSIDIWHCMAFGSETMHICITSTRVAQHSSVQKKKTFALNKCGWSPWEALLAISDVDVGYSEQRNHGPQRLNSFVWSHRCDIREKKRGASFIQYLP